MGGCFWREDAGVGNLMCLGCSFQNTITATVKRLVNSGVGKVWKAWVLWVGFVTPFIGWQSLRFPLPPVESKVHLAELILGCDGFPSGVPLSPSQLEKYPGNNLLWPGHVSYKSLSETKWFSPPMWQGHLLSELRVGAMDAGPWFVLVNPPMEPALAFHIPAQLELATTAVIFL